MISLSSLKGEIAVIPQDESPRLTIAVHTEEEFAWEKPFSRTAIQTTHIPALEAPQRIATQAGYQPAYFCGYPIAADREAADFLRSFIDRGQAHLGAHLHPWVCPPYEEDLTVRNSFHGNLPEALETRKILALTDALEQAFGRRPRNFLAGRYGIGERTASILVAAGYRLDLSPAPGWNYSAEGGPDFEDVGAHAFWNAQHPDLLHIPHSGGFIGYLTRGGRRPFKVDRSLPARRLRLPGIAARSGAIRRARLTIEGTNLQMLKQLTRALYRAGVRLFTLSFHSPSAAIGHTPYVRNAAERGALLDLFERYLAFFSGELGGRNITPEEAYNLAAAARAGRQHG